MSTLRLASRMMRVQNETHAVSASGATNIAPVLDIAPAGNASQGVKVPSRGRAPQV